MSWDLIRRADAAEPGSRDARGLRAVIDRVIPQLWAELQVAVFDAESSRQPLILTEISPLARYDHLDVLARLSDLVGPAATAGVGGNSAVARPSSEHWWIASRFSWDRRAASSWCGRRRRIWRPPHMTKGRV